MSMTENEAVVQINFDMEMIRFNPETGEHYTLEQIKAHNEDNYNTYIADEMAITALLEIQQYRAIGTVEEVQKLVSKGRAYGQVAGERDVAIEQLAEVGLSLGQKTDDVRAAVERMKPRKGRQTKDGNLACECGLIIQLGNERKCLYHCHNCGQAIDWSE